MTKGSHPLYNPVTGYLGTVYKTHQELGLDTNNYVLSFVNLRHVRCSFIIFSLFRCLREIVATTSLN